MSEVDAPRVEVLQWIGNTGASRRSGRRALVLPGMGYTVDHPLLFWACQVLAAGDWAVSTVRWTVDDDAAADLQRFVDEAAAYADRVAPDAAKTVVVGKSLGTQAAGWARERAYPGIWLTPLFNNAGVREALLDYGAPGLLVGGTADATWDAELAARTGLHVLQVRGGDHALHVGTDWRASLHALRDVMAGIESFASRLGDAP